MSQVRSTAVNSGMHSNRLVLITSLRGLTRHLLVGFPCIRPIFVVTGGQQ